MPRWAVMCGKKPVNALDGDLQRARRAVEKAEQDTGLPHCLEVFSKKFETIGVGEYFRIVNRSGFGRWELGPVCKRLNESGSYEVVGVPILEFPMTQDAFWLANDKEVLPWLEGEPP